MNPTIETMIADELSVKTQQVTATIDLIDQGATIPFIARYRKEATGCLDDIQLRKLHQRLGYLRELQERRDSILKSIREQGKMTAELQKIIQGATTKTELEDCYLPYKVKRRNKASLAREAGLAVLADKLLNDPTLHPEETAAKYINAEKEFADEKDCLEGARFILMESFSEDASLLAKLRHYLSKSACIQASKTKDSNNHQAQKYRDYFDYQEPINKIPSHRILAIFRGRNEGALKVNLLPEKILNDNEKSETECLDIIARHWKIRNMQRPADQWLGLVVKATWRVKLLSRFEKEFFTSLKDQAEKEAIVIFAKNLNDLLLAAPAGQRVVMGLDPALRTGVKIAVIDGTGKLLTHSIIFPHAPQNQWSQSLRKLQKICEMHKVSLISIGNGTGSRETERLVKEVVKLIPDNKPEMMLISEAGASIYSASELASKEFPDLDVSIRGAVSIARRIQDPLSELVKIDPKAIGVGQYQHDVNQRLLSEALDGVVEYCVNATGVELNMASAELLSKVAGISRVMSENIVNYRDEKGGFSDRQQLLSVERLGNKAFEQCAGFLRISDGDNPLDASAVHPEAYRIVEKILEQSDAESLQEIMGNGSMLKKLSIEAFTDDEFGAVTVKDIISELEKPGRDPRPVFKTVNFKEGVETLNDIKTGMVLEGVVSNVTNFGAFVDIGIHQDGLVHISLLSDSFVSDPSAVVKAGDIVKVWVVDIDEKRNRVSLSMIPPEKTTKQNSQKKSYNPQPHRKTNVRSCNKIKGNNRQKKAPVTAFGSVLSDALSKKK